MSKLFSRRAFWPISVEAAFSACPVHSTCNVELLHNHVAAAAALLHNHVAAAAAVETNQTAKITSAAIVSVLTVSTFTAHLDVELLHNHVAAAAALLHNHVAAAAAVETNQTAKITSAAS
ncbi:hypothetical protein J6590_017990 [Homalodisca vitripennis]|nr:hypothetical protein J6590_017990 [Homalodisca vitripennis]